MSPFNVFSNTVTVSALVMAPPAILLIDSDTVNWQLQNVTGTGRDAHLQNTIAL